MKKIDDKTVHTAFDIGLSFKGLDALLEITVGIGLLFLTPQRMQTVVEFITYQLPAHGVEETIARYLIAFGHSFSISSQHFAVIYMLSHGILKMVVILFLWRQKLWAYPISIYVFVFFIAFQMYRFTETYSVMLILLTILDLFMIALTILEYRRIKSLHRDRVRLPGSKTNF